METDGEVGSGGAADEEAVGIVPARQRDDAGDHAGAFKALRELARSLLAGLLSTLSLPTRTAGADLPGIQQALAATRHLLEMYRRQLSDEKTRRKLQRLDKRLRAVTSQLDRITTAEKRGNIGRSCRAPIILPHIFLGAWQK